MASTCKPKVYYFDAPYRAEPIRLLLIYCGVEFEDIRFKGDEWTKTYKDQSPLGVSPFYEEGDLKLGGSMAILRYVAEKNGLGGRNPIENAQLESYSDFLFDLSTTFYGILLGPEDKREEFIATAPKKLAFIEKEFKSPKNFLAGDKTSYCDVHACMLYHLHCSIGLGDVYKDCPKFIATANAISEEGKIIEYRKTPYNFPTK